MQMHNWILIKWHCFDSFGEVVGGYK